jgi:hypothetical protein
VHASNPTYADKIFADYERALVTEIAMLQMDEVRPEMVVVMVNDMPVSAAEIVAAGNIAAAKLHAIDRLIEQTIGVDIYILSAFSDERTVLGFQQHFEAHPSYWDSRFCQG